MGQLEGFSAPLIATEGVRWLKEDRDKKKPFLLSVWTHEPHLPIESAEEYMKPYAHIDDEGIRQHHGNITQLDHAFGVWKPTSPDGGDFWILLDKVDATLDSKKRRPANL